MKRVLFVTKFALEGPSFGGLTRTTRFVTALRSRFEVRVIGFTEGGRPSPRGRFSSLASSLLQDRPYQVARYDTRWLRRTIHRELEAFGPDVLHVDYLHQAPLLWDVPLPKFLDLHNVESSLSAGIARSSTSLATRFVASRDAALFRDIEDRAGREFDVVSAPSAAEARRMPGPVHVLPNGVDPSREPLDVRKRRTSGCFVGVFSWQPNADGAEWLVREVLPKLPENHRVELVGRNPAKRVRRLAGQRVTVTGEVADTWPHVCRAGVVLAPLRSPGGTRHKILEGLLAARPVVATREAADGLEELDGAGLVVVDDADEFASAFAALAGDPKVADELGARGRAAVLERFAWERTEDRLLALYDTELGMRSTVADLGSATQA